MLLLLACTADLVEFEEHFPASMCEWATSCGEGSANGPWVQACEPDMREAVSALAQDETCEFRPRQAALCLDTLQAQTCEDRVEAYYECKRVFRGEDCSLDLESVLAPDQPGAP